MEKALSMVFGQIRGQAHPEKKFFMRVALHIDTGKTNDTEFFQFVRVRIHV